MKWADLEARLEKGETAPVFALCGPEILLADEALQSIGSHVMGADWSRMNTESFRAPESTPGQVLQSAMQSGLFSEKRLVIYNQWESASRAPDREKKTWLKYLAAPSSSTCLVLRSQLTTKELIRKGKFFADSLQQMVVVDFWHLYPKDAMLWIRRRGEALGLKLMPDVAKFLVDHIGADLLSLRGELEKLSLLLDSSPEKPKEIDMKVLGEMKGRGVQASAWECVRSLVEGKTLQALQYFPSATEEDRPTGLVWKIQYQAVRQVFEGDVGWGTRLLQDCYHWERDLKWGRWPGSLDSVALEILFLRAHRRRMGRASVKRGLQ
ncbi:MAG: DNA polymerase III subunit delta [Candidatus Eisenbacteria bacterium]|uniref:DNA polymerase III subunit delta n=1 Tax=Eiseniibacteriota bacterium TaxID=2212470 RepID=A0A948RWB6_UNCEI|nr:DNA polymerase III subunit delta [Candidatus Eisenbacteria bacterium]MBU2691686.1 DNA polymerase III subunit delta [Candidatus Eisenbacteria bacterium]